MSAPDYDYELSERIEALSDATASGEYLLTVAVPPDRPVGEALERVEEEHAEAEYLGDADTDAPLREALDRARRILHRYEDEGTPENGLALYVGRVDGELVEHVFDDLPGPVRESAYARGNEFDLTPLEAAAAPSQVYGLVVVERGGAALGRLEGERVEPVETIDSDVPGKTRAGGQSADRFERERERRTEEFFETVAGEAARAFLAEPAADGAGEAAPNREGGAASDTAGGEGGESEGDGEGVAVDGLLVGGTTVTAEAFLDGGYLDHRLRDRVLNGAFSVEYATEQGLDQLVERARDALAGADRRPARTALDRLFEAIEADEAAVYGREPTEEALEYDAVETLLVSEALPAAEIRELEEHAADQGGGVVVIPEGIDRGEQFREAFGGVGALLRFPIE